MRSFEGRQIPFKVQHRYRPAEYGNQLVRMFLLKNDTESKLGTTPLPDGIVRVYRDNGKDGLSFRVQQQIKYVPIGDKIELNLGPDPEVIHEWVKLKTWREHLWFQREGVNVYKEFGGGNKVEIQDVVVGWEDHVRYAERIRNYRAKPIEVELRRAFPGDVAFISKLEPVRYDYQTVQLTATCPPGKKTELAYHVRTHKDTWPSNTTSPPRMGISRTTEGPTGAAAENRRLMTNPMRYCWTVLLLFGPALASNIDLSTVPSRDTVQLTIYNAEDLTLVRETRRVTFKKGLNPLEFSWANTLIDPTSATLRFPKQAGRLEVLDTTYPLDKPHMLYWNVQATEDIEAAVEVSYFTSGITWSADYVCITDPAETVMDITGFVRVFNNSGEEYEHAQVRLVVGTINLVEKIAELAHRGFPATAPMDQSWQLFDGIDVSKTAVLTRAYAFYDADGDVLAGDGGDDIITAAGQRRPKLVQKEGLGEYFIYTVEGTETIPNGWSKRLRSFDARQIPFKIQYRYRPAEYGDHLVRMFLLKNDTDSKLGTTPLPDGIVRVYRDNGKDGLSFRVQQQIKYVPIGDKIELNLGLDPEVIHEWIKLKTWREHILVPAPRPERLQGVRRRLQARNRRHGGRLGGPRPLRGAHPQLPRQTCRSGTAAGLPRRRGLHQQTGTGPLRLPDGPVDCDVPSGQKDRTGLSRPHARKDIWPSSRTSPPKPENDPGLPALPSCVMIHVLSRLEPFSKGLGAPPL